VIEARLGPSDHRPVLQQSARSLEGPATLRVAERASKNKWRNAAAQRCASRISSQRGVAQRWREETRRAGMRMLSCSSLAPDLRFFLWVARSWRGVDARRDEFLSSHFPKVSRRWLACLLLSCCCARSVQRGAVSDDDLGGRSAWGTRQEAATATVSALAPRCSLQQCQRRADERANRTVDRHPCRSRSREQ
jgi:hypothetical protein